MRIAPGIALGVAALLLGFEVSMLGIGLFGARVSPAYRAFYINRTIEEWSGESAQEAGLTSR